ncbi:hypothetical protein ES705_14328 [subsurface metagenome]
MKWSAAARIQLQAPPQSGERASISRPERFENGDRAGRAPARSGPEIYQERGETGEKPDRKAEKRWRKTKDKETKYLRKESKYLVSLFPSGGVFRSMQFTLSSENKPSPSERKKGRATRGRSKKAVVKP